MMEYFRNRKLWIATKHGKEKVIAPIFEKELGVITELAYLDTDTLGTFSGEIPRLEDPLNTLRKKCRLAIDKFNADLVIASEGSFGMHPLYHFIPANEEWLLLMDTRNQLEIFVREISTETNFYTSEISTLNNIDILLDKMLFPSHGVILRIQKDQREVYIKGIHDKERLMKEIQNAFHSQAKIVMETDMRAHHNPTRMKIIGQATLKLLEKINSVCSNCHSPGYGIFHSIKGLLCTNCNLPTDSILYHVYRCQKCNHEEKKHYPYGKKFEDPQFCQFCNP